MGSSPQADDHNLKSVDVLTATAYPEMLPMARWLIKKQDYRGPVNHIIRQGPPTGRQIDRRKLQVQMLRHSHADYFMFADDDDWLGSSYLRHLVKRIGDAQVYGELPKRIYYMRTPSFGEAEKQRPLLSVFTLYSADVRQEVLDGLIKGEVHSKGLGPVLARCTDPPFTDEVIVMRGLMNQPENAITARKNRYDSKVFPCMDPEFEKLLEWVGPQDFAYYMAFKADRGW